VAGSFEADPFSLDIPQRRSLWLLLVHSERRPPDHLRLLRGDEMRVLRANAAFRAVALPTGSHVVDLVYRPRSVSVGAALSLAAAAVFLLVACARGRRPPADSGAETS
jgi:hypothetical protein